jgi:hypothetical protein
MNVGNIDPGQAVYAQDEVSPTHFWGALATEHLALGIECWR